LVLVLVMILVMILVLIIIKGVVTIILIKLIETWLVKFEISIMIV